MKKLLLLDAFVLALVAHTLSVHAAIFHVFIDDGIYQPANLTILQGDTVEWYNDEHVFHTATSTAGVFASGMLDHEETFRFAFTESGSYSYYCEVYPTMTGTIVVGSGGGGGNNEGGELVNITGFAFDPADLSISVGDTVRWVNNDTSPHTVTAINGFFDSGNLNAGQEFMFIFSVIGDYEYVCAYHSEMTGAIHVTGSTGGANTVTINNFAFSPADLTIQLGGSVSWTNLDNSPHTVTSVDGSFDSGNLGIGQSFSYTFSQPGDYPYVCAYHSNMTGVIRVMDITAVHEIQIANFAFVPQELQISVGDSVRWTNLDSSPHTATAIDNSFNSGNLSAGQSYTHVFASAGSYPYVCAYHSNMTGVIHVGHTGGGDTTWHELPSPTSLSLNDIRFLSSDLGWIAGNQGILRTIDGGDNWSLVNTSEDMEAVYFVSTTEGWTCGNDGSILHSTNGGQSWSPQNSGEVEKLRDIWFADASVGWAVGRDGILIHTNDGGLNWSPQTSPATDDLRGIHMIDNLRGWAVGSRGLILYTDDGGANWITQLSSPNGEEDDFEAIFALNADTAWVAGGQGRVFATFNGGSSWEPQASGTATVLNDIHFANAEDGLTAGGGGYIAHGMDAGGMWHTQEPPAFVTFNGVWVAGSEAQFVVCADGRIFRKDTGTVSGSRSQIPISPNSFTLEANYPNPFNPATMIEFTMMRQGAARLEVFDILGRSVEVLLNEQLGGGAHQVQFNGANLSSGKYFYRLNADGQTQTRIMTLLK